MARSTVVATVSNTGRILVRHEMRAKLPVADASPMTCRSGREIMAALPAITS